MLACLAALQIGLFGVDSAPRPISQLVHTTWTAKDGAPADVIDLGQTSDGYLWLGTRSGLVRFDGVRFVPFAPQRGDTIPAGGVRRLLGARDGSLWIVWLSGVVSHLRDGRVRSYGEQDGLSVVLQLTESSTGMLVAGMQKGLAHFAGGKWKDVSREWQYPGTESKAVWFDRDGALWAQTEDRVVYRPARGQRFLDPGYRVARRAHRADFAQEKDGTIWMAELSRSAHTVPRVGDTQPISEVIIGGWTLLIDRKGSLWIGTAGDGLRRVIDPTRIRGKTIAQFGPEAEHFTEKNGLLSDIIYALFEDREGNVWVATTRGLERFREGAFSPLATPGSVRLRFVYATNDTSVWTATQNVRGIIRLRPGRQEMVPGVEVQDVFEDTLGALWGFNPAKILRLNAPRSTSIRLGRRNAQTMQTLSDVIIDRAGVLWVFDGTLGSLLRQTNDSLIQVAQLPPPAWPGGNLFIDRQGRIWISQMNRVALYDHGRLRVFGPADGVGAGIISGVFQDHAGSVWIATDAGLGKFDGVRFRTTAARQALPGRVVFGVAEDEAGAWWVVTRTGVLRLPRGEMDRALADSNHTIQYRSFDQRDGLPGAVSGAPWGPQVTRAADGRIWVATDSGVASIDPRSLPTAGAPPVHIETIRIDGDEQPPSDTISIPPGSHSLEIDYTATSLSIPDRVQFRYRLDGADATWQDVGTRRRAYYSALAPGPYRFRIVASNGDGLWNETGASVPFRILPAWYQTLTFRVGLILAIGALGAMAAVLVQRRRHLRSQETLRAQYEATLAERTRIAQDLHDTLLQGFAGVTLQLKTAELALPEQPDVAAETIMRVQQLARTSLREARERVWDMRETGLGSNDLPNALEAVARERTAGTGIEVSVDCMGRRRRVAHPVEDAAFRIGREAVANAIRHAEARRVEIHVDFRPTRLCLEVRDDGRGFTSDEAEAARQRGHFGLTGAIERASRMGGTCDVFARPGGGTVVAVELPLPEPGAR
jgi:signal transduction histidine kinase/ligand-binding sensor domain-containing protein